MLDLAIAIDSVRGITVIETNAGLQLKAPDWPQDCEFQLVAYQPEGKTCEIVRASALAEDIRNALEALEQNSVLGCKKPGWYDRLAECCKGVSG